MLLNILHPALNSSVICNTVATENYEPSNLISSDIQKSCLGFLAYSCVKPPVDLHFKFTNAFDIRFISIWPSVASQKSVGFVILTENSGSMTIVGTGYLSDEPGVMFYRRDAFSKRQVEHISSPMTFYKTTLRNVNKELSHCTNIIIRIVKTANSSVPAISKIQIWGFVSKTCGRDLITKIHNLWCKEAMPRTEDFKESQEPKEIEGKTHNFENTQLDANRMEVPEEFLDLITYNIMSIPLVLPSGNVIDQDTLDKHTKQEAVWGRPPSDPFTGQPFNNYRKPFISFALKGKIEKFLSENSANQELFKIPRVAGYFVPNQTNSTSNISSKHLEHNHNRNQKCFMNLGEQIPNASEKNYSKKLLLTQKYKSILPFGKQYGNTKVKSKFKQIDRNSLVVRACFECNVSDKLLKIICGHFICRICISNSKNHKCRCCGQEFSNVDVQNCI